ncbi:hypothetical protein BH20GEM2_BH20GEM2_02320 [soil metagenome]
MESGKLKLLVVFVHPEHVAATTKSLVEEGFRFTQVESTSGLLQSETKTFLIGIEADQLDLCTEIFRRHCREREIGVPGSLLAGIEIEPGEFNIRHRPVTVGVGGAVGFVVDVDSQFRA